VVCAAPEGQGPTALDWFKHTLSLNWSQSHVGASLLANAEFHSDASVPDRAPSRASSLPHGALVVVEISVQTEFHLWERACSRMRCVIQMHQCLTGPLREQARSHMGIGRGGDFGPNRIPFVGANLLANAGCHSDASVPDRTSSRASSLPHGALAVAEISVQTEFHLWERALVVPKISVQTEFHLWERACSRMRQSIRRISVRSSPSHPPVLCTRQCSPATATGAVAR
jgi:hypothetical protein